MKRTWYTKVHKDSLQGLVVDENTGKNIAVTYDPQDAPLVSASPDLFEACESAQSVIYATILDLREMGMTYIPDKLQEELRKIDAAIAKAKGE